MLVAAGVMMWPSRGLRQAANNTPPAQKCDCRVIEVIHYGGNLIYHERLLKDIVGSGNNGIGRERVEAMNKKCCAEQK